MTYEWGMEAYINTINPVRAIFEFPSQERIMAEKTVRNYIFNIIQKVLIFASF